MTTSWFSIAFKIQSTSIVIAAVGGYVGAVIQGKPWLFSLVNTDAKTSLLNQRFADQRVLTSH